MAFATLEEAWGVRAFAPQKSNPTPVPLTIAPPPPPPPKPARQPLAPRRPQQPVPLSRPPPASAQQRVVREAAAAAYRAGGREGLARLLGDDVVRALSSGPLGSLGAITFETVVMLLIAAFAIFVIIDALF